MTRQVGDWTIIGIFVVLSAAIVQPSVRPDCDFSRLNPIRISGFIPSAVVGPVFPEYPHEVIHQRLQGRVSVRILVAVDGSVARACAVQPGRLGVLAEIAAKKWTFKKNFGFDRRRYGDYAAATLVFVFTIKQGVGHVGYQM